MLSKNEVKDIQSLRHKKQRDEGKVFIAEGPKIVSELLGLMPEGVEAIYGLEEWVQEHEGLLRHLPVRTISAAELVRISQLQTPHAVLGVFRQLPVHAPDPQKQFCLYLDAIQDPGNFGTIIRIADWFGIRDIVCSEGCADRYNPKVVQSTMASIARVNVFADADGRWLYRQQAPVYAATLHGRPLYELPKAANGVLIIGNESKGIHPDLQQLASQHVTIPRKGEAESLNAAVATGIILSHLLG
ncbi:RNA methyltransferase [Paraflavisolibacter sp. H34]|uniref:TrmH family RNA methyltransferase n=1 Tax=Huijunlia imazamoxiresistens TaxID=3127457 RepID=UPI003019624B